MKTLFVSKTRKEKSGFASKSVKYFLFIFLLFPSFSLYPDTSENYCHTILFLKDKYDLNYELKHNAEIIAQIDSLIHFYYTHHRIDSLFLSASASFDGGSETNESLSAKRSGAIKKYLLENFPYLDQYPIRISKTGEDWDGFKEMVVVDENVPDKKNLLDIIDNPYWTSEQKEARIRQLAKGDTYNYLSENILPFQRKAVICISFSLVCPPPPPPQRQRDREKEVKT
jgi:hypothetical protein